jgi:DNA-binding response OmpR family regulator
MIEGTANVRVLVAEDDALSRRVVELALRAGRYEIVSAVNGGEAWEQLQKSDAPKVAILDWMMPVMDGPEVCRKVRQTPTQEPPYLILLTAKDRIEDIVTGFDSGADDYVVKPFEREELLARVRVGLRMLRLQSSLLERVQELEGALAKVNQLQGLLPICSYCKKVRNDNNYWQQVEAYVAEHSAARFSHGICPTCYETVVKPQIEEIKKSSAPKSRKK